MNNNGRKVKGEKVWPGFNTIYYYGWKTITRAWARIIH